MYWRESMMGGYGYSPFFLGGVGLLSLWDLAWKGYAMWRAAKRNESWWFVGLMLFNTMGLLPIAYLLIWGKEAQDEKVIKNVVSRVKKLKKKK